MSASTQTLQPPRRVGASAAVVLVAILVAIVSLATLAPRVSDRTPVAVPAPTVSAPERLSPGAAAAGRQTGPASIGSIRPSVLRDGSVKIGSSAGFVPPHGAGDFRRGAARTSTGVAATKVDGYTPIQVGRVVCHQCR